MRVHSRNHAGRALTPGFTLIELMVTLVIFAVVAVAITVVLMTSAKSKQNTSQRLESEQTARAAIDLLARDIRTAGYGADLDYPVTPQPAIAYVDAKEIILSENQSPYPDNALGPVAPLAYNPTANPKPFPLNGTAWAPPARYRTGAELVRYTLDVNNDGVVDASDISSAQGADAAATPNPNDYVLVRQVYGDSTGNVANNNGGTTERVALVRKPGDPGVPALFTVYMRGLSTPWDWANGPVPAAQLSNIQRVELQVTAASSRADAHGQYAQTTLKSEVNATRSVPNFGAPTYSVSGYVYNDLNSNRVKDGSDVGLSGATVRMGAFIAYTNSSGFYQIQAPSGYYTLKHSPPMGYGSFSSPDTFNLTVAAAPITRSFADTARVGGNVTMRAFDDTNVNGVLDAGEAMLPGISFTLLPGSPNAPQPITDASGVATQFTAAAGYSVTCNNPDSLTVTSTNPQTGTMSNGGSVIKTFGLAKTGIGHVTGRVFIDTNRNGTLDGSEAGLANVWVGVSKDAGLTVAGYAYTDATGNYNITAPVNDPPHTTAYAVYIIPPPGYFPTSSSSLGNQWLQMTPWLTNKNFGLANFQVITLTASRVLSLISTDMLENDWNGNHTENAHGDQDLVLGADAGGTDNVSVWFNGYPNSQFNSTADYSRLAPNSVMAMAADTLDKNGTKARPDLVTGTKFTAAGNFFVWFNQGTNNNEGYLPLAFSPSQNYKTSDNGDVQAVLTYDCGGGSQPDIIVGSKGATAGQGQVEVWLNNDATTPAFTRDETYTTANGSTIGEVTGMALADLDNDGDKDLVVVTRQSDYSGQVIVFENRGRTTGNRFVYAWKDNLNADYPTCVTVADADGDGFKDIFVGTARSTSQGRLYQYKNYGAITPLYFSTSNGSPPLRVIDAGGIVMSITAGDFGGTSGRSDLAVGYRTSTAGYGGGVRVYYLDLGVINGSGIDPSAGLIVNMVPAETCGNFNYGVYPSIPAAPWLTDFAVGVKSSATGGSLVVFVR